MFTNANKQKHRQKAVNCRASSWKHLKNNKEVIYRVWFHEKCFIKQWSETFSSKTQINKPHIVFTRVVTHIYCWKKPWNENQIKRSLSLPFLKVEMCNSCANIINKWNFKHKNCFQTGFPNNLIYHRLAKQIAPPTNSSHLLSESCCCSHFLHLFW